MSNQIPKLISQLTGSEKLEACFNICEITNINDIRNVTEKTLENIEKFIRKKCASIPIAERRQFIDDDIVNTPDKFMIAPGLGQRILNTCGKMSTIFKNVPANDTNIAAVSTTILKNNGNNNGPSTSTVSVKLLETVMNNCNRGYSLNSNANLLTAPTATPITPLNLSLTSRPTETVDTDTNEPMEFHDIPHDPLHHLQLHPPIIESLSVTPPLINPTAERSSAKLVESLVAEFLPLSKSTVPLIKTEATIVEMETNSETTAAPLDQSLPPSLVKSESMLVVAPFHQPSSPLQSALVRLTPRRSLKPHDIDYYYSKVVDDGDKFFRDCRLIPKIDFDIELNVRGKVETQRCANFVCHRCQATLKREKKLKFYLTARGAIINSNIINHLKIHYAMR